jgi:hypothetical protein
LNLGFVDAAVKSPLIDCGAYMRKKQARTFH